jgi:hypothetical protein
VEGLRVTSDERGRWHCECGTSSPDSPCAHIVRAQRLRKMRGVKRTEHVIEFEWAAVDLQALACAVPDERPPPAAHEAIRHSPGRARRRLPWAAMMAAAVVAVLSSGISYVAGLRAGISPLVVTRNSPRPSVASSQVIATPVALPPVRYANPFDPGEIFEFPAGTSPRQAHDSVAQILLDRARQRLASLPEARRSRS